MQTVQSVETNQTAHISLHQDMSVKEREARKTTRGALLAALQAARTSVFPVAAGPLWAPAAGGGLSTSLGGGVQGEKAGL